jgi:hypothetical protein
MSTDYLTRVATKLLGLAPVIRPRAASRFEPLTSAAVPTARAPAAEVSEAPLRAPEAMVPRDRSPRPLLPVAQLAQKAVDHVTESEEEPEEARPSRALARAVVQTEAFPGHEHVQDSHDLPDAHDRPDARDTATSVTERSTPPRARVTTLQHASSAGERESVAPASASRVAGTRQVVATALATNAHDGSSGSPRRGGSVPRETVATGQHIPALATQRASMPPFHEAEHGVDASTTASDPRTGADTPPQASAAATRSTAPTLKVDPPAALAARETHPPIAAGETHPASRQASRAASVTNAVSVTATPVTAWQETSRRVPMPDPARERGEPRREPPIHVTIGRIEIRATPSAPVAPTPHRRPALMGLDEYLRRKTGGGTR